MHINRGCDVIRTALHTSFYHLERPDPYIRMLLLDFSPAFNTVIPNRLVSRLHSLGLNWTVEFLTDHPQTVRLGKQTSSTLSQKSGVPQGCVLNHLLYTHDCLPVYAANTVINLADDTTVIGLSANNDESAYRSEV